MRAVNLIPADQRRGAGGLAGRSGGVVYVFTGGLAVLVALGVVYALAVNSVASRKTELASVTRQVAVVNLEAQTLAPYVQIAAVAAEKVHEVTTLAQQRFNWPSALKQLALALPSDVTFTSFTASGAGGAGSPASTPAVAGTPTTATSTGPSFALTGCASTQSEVAGVLTSLFQVPGVSDVKLLSTAEAGSSSPTKGSGRSALPTGGSCPLVTFTVGLTYAGSYTVPDSNVPNVPSTPSIVQTAASSHSAGSGK